MVARAGLAAVTVMGFPELANSDWEEYEELAVALATDPVRLRALQQGLSTARTTSPFFDTPRPAYRAPFCLLESSPTHAPHCHLPLPCARGCGRARDQDPEGGLRALRQRRAAMLTRALNLPLPPQVGGGLGAAGADDGRRALPAIAARPQHRRLAGLPGSAGGAAGTRAMRSGAGRARGQEEGAVREGGALPATASLRLAADTSLRYSHAICLTPVQRKRRK